MCFDTFTTPVGTLIVVQDEQGLRYIDFQDGPNPLTPMDSWQRDTHFCQAAREQLLAYFASELLRFELPLAPIGTAFQQRVWRVLAQVPYGTTMTYGEMAQQLNQPSASRAVGMANGRNPLAIVLPCHRVVGANRTLTGYRGGLPIKTCLLKLEGLAIDEPKGLVIDEQARISP
ncbi:methylated-DNA--[protein]-cysteine S-methyltransferase [Aestuariicella hydrocarbonica]|uniref:Methylated-DNA--protein-cysteine methyltransferase n=2 Tax=Pseudomaricurvus hydrocarbonicus TaxID=1470433 RepID=A0A9E5JVZ6_9GAMM|nr:methylated-DNA--[protein]-cysteine S-methyltransferase [Aestuariicella hydrocarbonica]